MSDSDFVKDALREQAQHSPDADMVMHGIRSAVARRRARKRQAWTGATALVVAAAITLPVVAFGGRQTDNRIAAAAQPSAPASSPSTTPVGPAPTSAPAPARVVTPSRTSPATTRPTSSASITTHISATPTSTRPTPTSRTSTAPARAAGTNSLLDPAELPAGLMPEGWILYGVEGGALVYGVMPTPAGGGPTVKLSIATWSGVSWSTCAGLPARTVDNGQGRSHITMKIDSTHAYYLDLDGEPDFSPLTQGEVETVKSIGIDLCGNDMVWNPSDSPLG